MTGDELYLRHLLDSMARIERYIAYGQEAFFQDTLLQDGVIRNLAVIGEAVKKLSSAVRESCPEIPWRQIAGMRDVLIHEYSSVDLQQVWAVTQNDLPALKDTVEALLAG